MFGRVSRLLFSVSFVAVLASCNSLGFGGDKPAADQPSDVVATPAASTVAANTPANAANTVAPLVQGTCPPVSMRDAGAFYSTYAKGAKDDPQQLMYQASIADFTRQCTINENSMNVTVVAQGRLVAGPAGGSGKVMLPVRITVSDGATQLYSEVTNFEAEIPAGATSAQFLFRKDGVALPGGAGALARINIGFDQGVTNSKKKK